MNGAIVRYPKVSIVTPSLNQGKFIERTIRSVIEQDYSSIEYIVVDGGSTDETLAVLNRYGSRFTWVSEADGGQSDAINKGWKMSSGEIVAYLNSDDTYKAGAVTCAVEYFQNEPELSMVYSDVDIVDADDRIVRFFRGPEFDLQKLIRDRNYYLPQQGVFLRRSIVEKVGLLDESLHFKMDRDLYIRIGMYGRVRRIPHCLANGRLHPQAKSNPWNDSKAWREFILIRERYGAPVAWSLHVRRYLEAAARKLLGRTVTRSSMGSRLVSTVRERIRPGL